MTVADTRNDTGTGRPVEAPAGASSPPTALADVAAPPDQVVSVAVTCAAAALATTAAAVVLSGVFTGIGPRIVAVVVALVGPALVLASYRTSRPAAVQYLLAPVAVAAGAAVALVGGATGSATLPTLVADAVRGGGLGDPPIPFAPGWRFLLVTLLVLLGAGAASLGVGLSRPRIAVAAPVPVVVGAALVQPSGSAVTSSSVALLLLVAALTVAAGAVRAGEGPGSGSFELLRLVRGAVGLAVLAAVLAVLAGTGVLLPDSTSDEVVPPRPPTSAPIASDRVLFTVHTDAAGDTGPWVTGVLDSYVDSTWFLPSYDRSRLHPVTSQPLDADAAKATAARHVQVTVGDLAGRNVPSIDAATVVHSGQLRLDYDPVTGQLLSQGQQAPPGTSYTVDAAAVPTAEQLAAAPSPPASMQSYLAAPAAPAEVARVLAASATANRYERLQAARTFLFRHVVAAGKGTPVPVPPQRVADMFAGGHATPFEITAAEALLARWVGVPARIGFGYDGGVASRDQRTFAVHPANGATWLQTWWSGVGWVSIVGRPAQAVTPTSLDEHQHSSGVRGNGQLALVVRVPVELSSLRALYDDVRFYTLATVPWLLLLAAVVVFYPAGWKLERRRRRRRWAATRPPAARLLVAYAEMRDRLRDVDGHAANATPLEFCSAVAPDDEHWELAWLVTRALWGDLARDLRLEDVLAGEEMARSVRRRVLRAQRLATRVASVASRASLRDPWTDDVPNAWPSGRWRAGLRALVRRAGRTLRPVRVAALLRRSRPAPATAAMLVVAGLLLGGCATPAAPVAARLPAPFVPTAVGPYALRESTTAERAFSQAGSASLVTGGRVWTVVAPDGTVKGSLQAAAFRPSLHSRLRDVQRGVRTSIGSGNFTLTRLGDRAVYMLDQSEERLLLYFPPGAGYYELLDVRNDFTDAQLLMSALLDFQQGVQSRPVPPALDPRRGGD
jgi:hypothetical protein